MNQQLIKNLVRKRNLLERGDPSHEEIRPLLLVLGGGMQGVSGAGAALAFMVMNFGEIFDTVIGISTGAAIGAYFLGGAENSIRGISLYYNELARNFVNFRSRPIADIDYAESLFHQTIDERVVQNARSHFFVGVTNAYDGSGALINAKIANPNLVTAIKASVALPGLYGKEVLVNNTPYIDGSFHPFPVQKAYEMFQPTDIVVIANCGQDRLTKKRKSVAEAAIFRMLMRKEKMLRQLWLTRSERWDEGYSTLMELNRNGVNTEIIWQSGKVGQLTTNQRRLKQAAEVSLADTLYALGGENLASSVSLIDIQAG